MEWFPRFGERVWHGQIGASGEPEAVEFTVTTHAPASLVGVCRDGDFRRHRYVEARLLRPTARLAIRALAEDLAGSAKRVRNQSTEALAGASALDVVAAKAMAAAEGR